MSYKLLQMRRPEDKNLGDINKRWKNNTTQFNSAIVHDSDICPTLVSGAVSYRDFDGAAFSSEDCRNVQTFPQDYEFGDQSAQYTCGMSVPPVMMAQIATEVYQQWLKS